ncbi:hypothetical protein ACFL4G_02655 [Thermodesulfobacteriota bacterium]
MVDYTENIIIVSDLHLQTDPFQDESRKEQLFTSFLRWLPTQTKCGTLIFAGDTFDFLANNQGSVKLDTFDQNMAINHINSIISAYPQIFDLLSSLCFSEYDWQIIFLGGNHDVELAFSSIRDVIENRLVDGLPQAPRVQWFVLGEPLRLQLQTICILVEHGDELDDWNRVDHQAFLRDLHNYGRGLYHEKYMPPRYSPPPGSRIVKKFVNPKRRDFPWMGSLQPTREAVLPLIYHFLSPMERVEAAFLLQNELYDGLRSSVWSDFRRLFSQSMQKVGKHSGSGVYRVGESKDRSLLLDLLREYEGYRANEDENRFLRRILSKLKSVSAEDTFFEINEPDSS